MGIEKDLKVIFYAQCPKCRQLTGVDVTDYVGIVTLAFEVLQKKSSCFTPKCHSCKTHFVSSIGEVNTESCTSCEIRTSCLESGSAPLMYVYSQKRQALDLKF